MRTFCLIFFILLPFASFTQSLDAKRIDRIKNATVRIITDYGTGTGFFVNNKGLLLTCWHVVDSSFRNGKSIIIQMRNGDTAHYGFLSSYFNDTNFVNNSIAYDFCFLAPFVSQKNSNTFLKVGNYADGKEGDEVYTCGYPLGSSIQFVSKGLISTLYTNDKNFINTITGIQSKPRDEALLDLTINKGNSGGAIIKKGVTIDDDLVIGIVDFIINPLANYADSLTNNFSKTKDMGSISFGFYDPTKPSKNDISYDPFQVGTFFSTAISIMPTGVSGCVSIDYPNSAYIKLKP